MNSHGRTHAQPSGCLRNGGYVFDAVYSRGQVISQGIFFFSTKSTHQYQDAAAHTGIS
jgi:hypothetical protein